MPSPQPSLFDEAPLPAGALVGIPGSDKALSAEQRRFNRLVAEIEAERRRLADWQAAADAAQARAATVLPPLQRRLRQAQLALAAQLDELLSSPPRSVPKLTNRRREALREALVSLVSALLAEAPDAALEHLHDRHADVSLAEQARLDAEIAREMLGQMLGDDALPHDEAATVDDLLRGARDRLAAQARAEQAAAQRRAAKRAERRRASGKGPTRKEQQAQALDEARREASQSLREIYRRLASALHPDRASDAADGGRRTALMQRVNQAYESEDLLTLLGLQIEAEQIDAARMGALPDERVARYNLVLQEQLELLHAQRRELLRPFSDGRRVPASPEALRAMVDDDAAGLQHVIHEVETDCQRLCDPVQRIVLIDGWRNAPRS